MTQVPPSPPVLPTQEAPREPLFPAWHFLSRNRHVTVPLAVPGVFAWAGEMLRFYPHATTPAGVGAGVTAAAVWWAAPYKWDRASEQWYARLSAIAAGGWLTAAARFGLHAPELAALGAGSLAWAVPWFWHKRPHSRKRASVISQWQAWWGYYAYGWNLHGSAVYDVTTDGVIDTLHVQLNPGKQTMKQVRDALPLIESALQGHVEDGRTRVERVPGNPSCVLVHLKRENPLDEDVEWDDAVAPKSVTEQMPIGRDEAGEWVLAPMLINWFVIGATRRGKSNELNVLLASITGCRDAAAPWIIDRKGGRSARPWVEGAGWIATDIDEARRLLCAAEAEIKARALMAYDGSEQLVPTPDCPALFIVVDEAHGVLSSMGGDSECQRLAGTIASEGSGVNVHLIVLTQYGALHESVGSEQIRSNLLARMCFAVTKPEHGQFALADWASLDASRLENQGEFYWQLGPKVPSSPARGQRMDHEFVREIVARAAAKPRLVLYAQEHQETLDTWLERLPVQLHPDYVPPARRAHREATVTVPGETTEQILARIEEEVASLPDLPAPPRVDPALLADEMTRRKMLFCQLLRDAPPGGVSPKQLHAGTGLSTSLIHLNLRALIDRGAVSQQARGRYSPVTGQDIWAALMAEEAARAALAALAKEKISA